MTCAIQTGDTAVSLACHFLESGIFHVPEQHCFPHPSPPFNRIFLFRKGGCLVDTGASRHQLVPGKIYLLPINQSFDGTFANHTELLYFHMRFEHIAGRDIFQNLQGAPELIDAGDLFDGLNATYDPGNVTATLFWESLLFHVVCRFLDQLSSERLWQSVQGSQKHREMLEFIQREGTPALTIDELASRLGITRAALSKSFSRDMGVPLKSYLQQVFLEKACHLLLTTRMTVEQVAHVVGYEDHYYFHRVFKKYTRQTPMQYRRLAGEAQLSNFRNKEDIV